MSLLEVRDLHVWFDLPDGAQLHAVQGVNFDVEAGERIGLVGESGCGKTTTILAILSLLPPSATVAGDVRFEGDSILSDSEDTVQLRRWKDIAMVFQGAMNALNPVKTVEAQIVEPMELHGTAEGAAARRAAGDLLEMVGIPAAAGARYPHEFSGGMRQRAALAMALACGPKVLLADEPTTALDVMVQAQILELLTGLARELGLALVLVTHDLPVVAQVCERAAVMYAGEIVETGSIEDLFHHRAIRTRDCSSPRRPICTGRRTSCRSRGRRRAWIGRSSDVRSGRDATGPSSDASPSGRCCCHSGRVVRRPATSTTTRRAPEVLARMSDVGTRPPAPVGRPRRGAVAGRAGPVRPVPGPSRHRRRVSACAATVRPRGGRGLALGPPRRDARPRR